MLDAKSIDEKTAIKPNINVSLIIGTLVTLAAFFISTSRAINSTFILLSAVILLFAAKNQIWKNIRYNPVCSFVTLFIISYLIGLFYSSSVWHQRIDSFKHYSALMLTPILMVLFQRDEKWLPRISYALVYGSFFYLLICVSNYYIFPLVKLNRSGGMYLTGRCPFLLSISTYLALEFVRSHKGMFISRVFFIVISLFMIISLLFFSSVRSDYVTLIVALSIFAMQNNRKGTVITSAVAMMIIVIATYQLSPRFHNGINRVIHGIEKYKRDNPLTSSGLRLLFAHNGIILWKKRPIFGYGTGSFGKEYNTLHSYGTGGVITTAKYPLDQPHNQYVYTMVEVGGVGLVFLLAILGSSIWYSYELPEFQKKLAQVVTATFSIYSLFTSSLFYHVSMYSFSLLLSMCFYSLNIDTRSLWHYRYKRKETSKKIAHDLLSLKTER